jgi:outer membrane lipoprotein-sorting protein
MNDGCRRLACVLALLGSLPLSGCFVLSTTRRLPVPKGPQIVRTVSPDQLVARVNERWDSLKSLNATVDIQASVLKSNQGVAKDYTTFRGIILMRKPEMLRVFGRVPVIGTRMFDMVSDGKNFTLWIPSRNKVVKGPNELKKKSTSQVENMRPGFFFDAMMVRGLDPDDLYSVVSDTSTIEDAAKKHLYSVPEYVLSIMRRKPGSPQLIPVRVVTFHRDDLLPYQQDLYDDSGNLETEVFYSEYADFGSSRFPSRVTIKRPLEEYQIVMTVEKVVENMNLTDDQFEIKIPEGTQIQKLE